MQQAVIAFTISHMQFAWDKRKAASNLKKHGISFAEAASVFGDPLSMTFPDPDHSEDEERFITIGMSEGGQVLLFAHADRAEAVRIISARKATRAERSYYEENKS